MVFISVKPVPISAGLTEIEWGHQGSYHSCFFGWAWRQGHFFAAVEQGAKSAVFLRGKKGLSQDFLGTARDCTKLAIRPSVVQKM